MLLNRLFYLFIIIEFRTIWFFFNKKISRSAVLKSVGRCVYLIYLYIRIISCSLDDLLLNAFSSM